MIPKTLTEREILWLFTLNELNIGDKKYGAELVQFNNIGGATLSPRRYVVKVKGKAYSILWTFTGGWSRPLEVEQKTVTLWMEVDHDN